MTVREGSKEKPFDDKTLKYHLLSLPIDRAFNKIAQAIPKRLLEAVYLTVYKHVAEVRGCPTARTWLDAHVSSKQLAHRAFRVSVLIQQMSTFNFQKGRNRKQCLRKTGGHTHVYAPMSNLKTKAAWIYYNLRLGEFPPGYSCSNAYH